MEGYAREGKHWAESIGIPGIPSHHFEIRHRTRNREHLVDDIVLVGNGKSTSLFAQLGVREPQLVLGTGREPHFSKEEQKAFMPSVKNITEVLVALHEVAHYVQHENQDRSADLDGIDDVNRFKNSSVKVKAYLEKRGARININDELLLKIDMLFNQLMEKGESLSEDETREIYQELKVIDGEKLVEAFRNLAGAIIEQDATGRVLNTIRAVEELHGIDFSKVSLQKQPDYSFKDGGHFTMHPWFNPHSITAALDIGLASHQADVPLHALCKRWLGEKCNFDTPLATIKGLTNRPRYSRKGGV